MAYDPVCRVGDSNSIANSNRQAAQTGEALLWHALCDAPATALAYMDAAAVLMNPLLHPAHSFDALSADSSPSLADALAKLARSKKKWTSFHVHAHDPRPAFGQPAMMAVQIMYKVTLVREAPPRRQHRHRRRKGEVDESEEGAGGDETPSPSPSPNLQTVVAFCTSTWKQDSSGGWKLAVQQLVPVSG